VALVRLLIRLIWGTDVVPALRPVLAINLVASMAGSTWWSFMGIWAVRRLGAEHELPVALAISAALAIFSGFAGGHLSDHLGRRRLILFGESFMVGYPIALLLIGDAKWAGLGALAVAGALGSIGGSASQAMVADLVAPADHERSYAAVRVASNLGVTMGPPLGAALLFAGGWSTLFASVAVLSAGAWLIAYRFLPRGGDYAPEGPPERGSVGVILADRPFLIFLGSSVFAWLVYVAYEIAMPVSLVQSHGLSPAAWGLLVAINPLFVTLFQLRLTRAVAGVPAAPKLVAALLLMGLPFLFFTGAVGVVVIVLVIVLFVIGEMLWVPTSQAIVAGLAPEDVRGAYMGAFGAAPAIGFALSPLIGLSLRNGYGDASMWVFFAATAVVAAVLGSIACRGARRSLVSVAPGGA
jgi:predicted MFS family arabinose efflux permease